jgi:hypothetical protein
MLTGSLLCEFLITDVYRAGRLCFNEFSFMRVSYNRPVLCWLNVSERLIEQTVN